MKPNNSTAYALILSACFLFISAFLNAQPKSDRVEKPASAMPAITKGYYSIYNNADKLNSAINRKVSVNKQGDGIKSQGSISFAPQKGYYSTGRNAEKKREQMTTDRFDSRSRTSSGIIQNLRWPIINKGYYSIGNNAKKLHK